MNGGEPRERLPWITLGETKTWRRESAVSTTATVSVVSVLVSCLKLVYTEKEMVTDQGWEDKGRRKKAGRVV